MRLKFKRMIPLLLAVVCLLSFWVFPIESVATNIEPADNLFGVWECYLQTPQTHDNEYLFYTLTFLKPNTMTCSEGLFYKSDLGGGFTDTTNEGTGQFSIENGNSIALKLSMQAYFEMDFSYSIRGTYSFEFDKDKLILKHKSGDTFDNDIGVPMEFTRISGGATETVSTGNLFGEWECHIPSSDNEYEILFNNLIFSEPNNVDYTVGWWFEDSKEIPYGGKGSFSIDGNTLTLTVEIEYPFEEPPEFHTERGTYSFAFDRDKLILTKLSGDFIGNYIGETLEFINVLGTVVEPEANNTAEVETDKDFYTQGEIITVTGIVSEGYDHVNFYLKNTTERGAAALGAVENVTAFPPMATFQTDMLYPAARGKYYVYIVAYFSHGAKKEVSNSVEVTVAYTSADNAAIAFATHIYSYSAFVRFEYGGEIYSKIIEGNELFFLTDPRSGKPHEVAVSKQYIPDLDNSKPIAFIHTHPPFNREKDNYFSGGKEGAEKGDIAVSKKENVNCYLIGPNLELRIYRISDDSNILIANIIPIFLTDAQRAELERKFSESWKKHLPVLWDAGTGICDINVGIPCGKMTWPNYDYNKTWSNYE